ncbi:MAG: hypothetical protein CMH39_00590 [Micrococcales bacterium]|nr:hypothetical protein [Micrococcales bacterium]|tara:strand:- start:500 stop:694 length:195 start_codon:yes stop_codon:yes gene_type:complete
MTKAKQQARFVWKQLSTSERNELGDHLVRDTFQPEDYVDLLNEEPAPGFGHQISKIWFDWELDQ